MPRYIVVKVKRSLDKPDRYVTSGFPRPHLDHATAISEAVRLSEKEKKPFAIMQEVGLIMPPVEQVAEVKVGDEAA